MKSPFPGMDPYVEACGLWAGFHNRLIHNIDDALAAMLPEGYTVDTALRSYIVLVESEGKKESDAKPDFAITEPVSRERPKKRKHAYALAGLPIYVACKPNVEALHLAAFGRRISSALCRPFPYRCIHRRPISRSTFSR